MSEGDEFGWSTDLESVRPRRHALPAADRPLLSRRAARELAERLAAADQSPTSSDVDLPTSRRRSPLEVFAEPYPAQDPAPMTSVHWQTGPIDPVVIDPVVIDPVVIDPGQPDTGATPAWIPTEHWTTAELVAVRDAPEPSEGPLDALEVITAPSARPEPAQEPTRREPDLPGSALSESVLPEPALPEPVLSEPALMRTALAQGRTAAVRRTLETGPLRFDMAAGTEDRDSRGVDPQQVTDPWRSTVAQDAGAATTDAPATVHRASRRPRSGGSAPEPTPTAPAGGRRPNPGRNLPQAIAVGVGLAAAVLVSLLVRKEAFVALTAASVVVGVWELSHALTHRKLHIPVIPLAVGSVGMLVSAFVARGEGLFAALLLTSFGVLLWRLIDGVQGAARDVAAGVFAAVYVPFLGGWAMIMLAAPDGAKRVIVYVATVVASDVGGYAAGVLFGRHPMSPTISPKKSWEGFAGSVLVCAAVASAGVTLLLHGPIWAGAVLGPVVAVTATAGDLCESLIKRDLGVKDMGTVLPGHGGIMDRLDSMLFSAPAVYLALLLLVSST